MPSIDHDPVLRFMRLMWSVDHGLHKVSKRMSSVLGVTGQQRLAVRVIGGSPGITPSEVAEQMHLDPSTMTGILRRLEENRLIVRRSDPRDARRARLSLTDEGRQIDRQSAGTIEAAVRRALASCRPEEVDAASRVLATLSAQLVEAPRRLRSRSR
jgi:DNA-binding MarR family transcriptional regulator